MYVGTESPKTDASGRVREKKKVGSQCCTSSCITCLACIASAVAACIVLKSTDFDNWSLYFSRNYFLDVDLLGLWGYL